MNTNERLRTSDSSSIVESFPHEDSEKSSRKKSEEKYETDVREECEKFGGDTLTLHPTEPWQRKEQNDPSKPPNQPDESKDKQKKIRKLRLDTTQDFNAQLEKRGILYLSRVPPRMGPAKVKTLLSDFGPITRVYLVEEDKTVRKKRRQAGGSAFKRYKEGWVEFESKKIAKLVGETLNMTRVTNHKRSTHYDDLWSVKYLKGFKWSHLTEKVAYERRVREQKLRVEMMEVRRENASFIAQLEAGKKLDFIEERRKKRKERDSKTVEKNHDDNITVGQKRLVHQKKPYKGQKESTKSAILGSLL